MVVQLERRRDLAGTGEASSGPRPRRRPPVVTARLAPSWTDSSGITLPSTIICGSFGHSAPLRGAASAGPPQRCERGADGAVAGGLLELERLVAAAGCFARRSGPPPALASGSASTCSSSSSTSSSRSACACGLASHQSAELEAVGLAPLHAAPLAGERVAGHAHAAEVAGRAEAERDRRAVAAQVAPGGAAEHVARRRDVQVEVGPRVAGAQLRGRRLGRDRLRGARP